MSLPEGRIPRESNPTPNEKPGFLGSYKERSSGQMHPTTGADGGMDVNAISSSSDDLITAGNELLTSLVTKDFATEETLAAVLAKLIAAPSTAAKQDILAGLVGALDAAAVTDPTASAASNQLLKGILKQLQGTGTGSQPVTLTGSYIEINTNAVEGEKTATTTAVSMSVGGSALVGRSRVQIINPVTATASLRAGVHANTVDEIAPGEIYVYPVKTGVSVFVKTAGTGSHTFRMREW